ncbi:MAG: GNAT family N-acetyltransferase [Bacteroidales bacterium]|nr:GNAT family N-acetyltransferase [Bacteroidales bacterium]MBN2818700.1 GNAT family N-acetyltransferase [Bacteroidales bacterium]
MEHLIKENESFSDSYWKFVQSKYGEQQSFGYYFKDLQSGAAYCLNSEKIITTSFELREEEEIKAHIVLFQHSDLPPDQAFFGFFECVHDFEVFRELWELVTSYGISKGIKTFKGPVNGSIWHSYRVVSFMGDSGFFPSEPIIESYYNDFFERISPQNVILYKSAYRKRYNFIIRHTRKAFEEAINQGFSIEKLGNIDSQTAVAIYTLSFKIFNESWGYVPLNPEEFQALYSNEKIENYISSIYIVSLQNQIVGFCSNLSYANNLIMKTLAVDPEFQQKGIAKALVHKIHSDAKQQRVAKIFYALVRKGNKVKYFPLDDVKVVREYAAFEYKIG